jgi:hypothetical protein
MTVYNSFKRFQFIPDVLWLLMKNIILLLENPANTSNVVAGFYIVVV